MVSNVLNPDWIVSESNNLLVLDSFKLKLKLYKLGVSGDHNLGFRLLISKVTVLYSPSFSMIFFIDSLSIKISSVFLDNLFYITTENFLGLIDISFVNQFRNAIFVL